MALAGSVVSVKRVPAGQGVSYGFEYRTTSETTLALIPLGYADGVPRHASNRGPVRIGDTTSRSRAGSRWTSSSSTSGMRR